MENGKVHVDVAKTQELTAEHLLHLLSMDAAETLERPVSSSAMLLALLTYVGQQSPMWVAAKIFPLIK